MSSIDKRTPSDDDIIYVKPLTHLMSIKKSFIFDTHKQTKTNPGSVCLTHFKTNENILCYEHCDTTFVWYCAKFSLLLTFFFFYLSENVLFNQDFLIFFFLFKPLFVIRQFIYIFLKNQPKILRTNTKD